MNVNRRGQEEPRRPGPHLRALAVLTSLVLVAAALASCSSSPALETVPLAHGVSVTLPSGEARPAEASPGAVGTALTAPLQIAGTQVVANPITVLASPQRLTIPKGVATSDVRVSIRLSSPPGSTASKPFLAAQVPSGGAWAALTTTWNPSTDTATASWPATIATTSQQGASGSGGRPVTTLADSPLLSLVWTVISFGRSAVEAVLAGVLGDIFSQSPSSAGAPTCSPAASDGEDVAVSDNHPQAGVAACAQSAATGQVLGKVVDQRPYPVDLILPAHATATVPSADLFTELGGILNRDVSGWANSALLPGNSPAQVTLDLAPGQLSQMTASMDTEAYLVGIIGSGLEVLSDVGGVFGWTSGQLVTALSDAGCLRDLGRTAEGLSSLSLSSAEQLASTGFDCITAVASSSAIAVAAGLLGLLDSLVTAVVAGVWEVIDSITTGGIHNLTFMVGPGWSTETLAPEYSWGDVACASQSLCLGVQFYCQGGTVSECPHEAGFIQVASTTPADGAAGWQQRADQGPIPGGILCPLTTLCVGSDQGGNLEELDNPASPESSWSMVQVPASAQNQCTGVSACGIAALDSISCPSTSLCIGSDEEGFVTTQPGSGSWTFLQSDLPASLPAGDISCPGTYLCVATDGGTIYVSNYPTVGTGSWQAVDVDSGDDVSDVSCPTATLCVGFDQSGNIVSSTNPLGGAAAWYVTSVNLQLNALSCTTAGFCVGVGSQGEVLTWIEPPDGPVGWLTSQIDGGTDLYRVTCPSAGLCLAVDAQGNLLMGT